MTRVIAGIAGGRRLAVPPGTTTRPTSDRAREGLFASLLSELGTFDGARVLDLYAGSGAIGLEALSRGADQVRLVESDARAAAVIKAFKKNDIELANAVYSGVPAHLFGLEQIIEIGPMSGKSNILFWLEHRGVASSDGVVERIYQRAKASDHTLSEAEILECIERGRLLS